MTGMEGHLWGGRFTGSVDPVMEAFNASISYDKRLAVHDIMGSKAYATALYKVKLLTHQECDTIQNGLDQISLEWRENRFIIKSSDEDIHTANERRLSELTGDSVGGKLHTGRSRNDQVTTDMRLWLRDQMKALSELLLQLITALVSRAKAEVHIIIPGYTHLQRAQPILWSHWLLSYCWMLHRDAHRLRELYQRVNVLTLGSGALAGNPFGINREELARDLSFSSVSQNSLDATSDRDFIIEFLFWCSLVSSHLSKLSEDLIIYSSEEFGLVALSDAYSTGSSLMPQKKNADSLELIRGKSGRLFGKLSGFMMTCKALPSSYNKDLQEDKECMFDAYDTITGMLQIATGIISTVTVNESRCKAALTYDMLSTDLAYYLVRKGVAFREAHRLSGECVRRAEAKRCKLNELTVEDFQQISSEFDAGVMLLWGGSVGGAAGAYFTSISQYNSTGGTAMSSVSAQVAQIEHWLQHATTTTASSPHLHGDGSACVLNTKS